MLFTQVFRKWRYACLVMFATGLLMSPSLKAQCGDVDGSSGVDIGDITEIIDYLFITCSPLSQHANGETDNHLGVTISDAAALIISVHIPPNPPLYGCTPPLQAPLAPLPQLGNSVFLNKVVYPGGSASLAVTLLMRNTEPLIAYDIPFQVHIGGVPAEIVPGSLVPAKKNDGTNVLVTGFYLDSPLPAGFHSVVQFEIRPTTALSSPEPISLVLTPYPCPVDPNTHDPANFPIFIKSITFGSTPEVIVDAITPTTSEPCGDIDHNGYIDIADETALINYLFLCDLTGDRVNAELDNHENVTISDLVALLWNVNVPPFPLLYGCTPPLQPPLAPLPEPKNVVFLNNAIYPPTATSLSMALTFWNTDPLLAYDLPFQVQIGGVPAEIVPGSLIPPRKSDGTNVLLAGTNVDPPLPSGVQTVLEFKIRPTTPISTPQPISLVLTPYPCPVNPTTLAPAHIPMFIRGMTFGATPEVIVDAITPGVMEPCCLALTGNVDCDMDDLSDISDLTVMIDNQYISFAPLCCTAEANVDGSLDGKVDIADLTALINYLYINFTPPAVCQ